MASSLQPHSPGRSSILPPKLDTRAGTKSHLFQPPRTPASTSSAYRHDHGTIPGSRKRARPGASPIQSSTPYSVATSNWSTFSAESIMRSPGAASPDPLANTRYNLAGGLDTPSLATAGMFDGASEYGEDYFRRRWSDGRGVSNVGTPAAMRGERNGERRLTSSPKGSPGRGWGTLVFSIVGGVAGKMWQFGSSAFKGFYAGGGQGYEVRSSTEGQDHAMGESSIWIDVGDFRMKGSTPIPGHFPEDYFTSAQRLDQDSTPPRPAKRIHTDSGSGWVMVTEIDNVESRLSTPRVSTRGIATVSSATRSNLPRPVASPRPAASRAASRRSLLPVSRHSSLVSHAGSPALQANRPASMALQRSPGLSPAAKPPSVETKKFADRIAREEIEADKSMRRLNAQLKAMIKEGKEALGTKVEVVDDLSSDHQMDEGFDEGYFEQSTGKW